MSLLFPVMVFGAFSISADPYDGGYDLNFGKVGFGTVSLNKEVRVSINSDIAARYRVIQVMLDPLTDARGNYLPVSCMEVYGVRGSNNYGTLNVEERIPVSQIRQTVYTSSHSGDSDSFILVYSISPDSRFAAGSYRGRIGFILEPIDSTRMPVNVILTVLADIEASEAVFDIQSDRNNKEILLEAERQEAPSSVVFTVRGGLGRQFRVYQMITQQPLSIEGNQLSWESVQFSGRGASAGSVNGQPEVLSPKQELIYESSPDGAADTFAIDYSLADLSGQKAGVYTAAVKYLLETAQGEIRLLDTFVLNIDSPRVFELEVKPESGGTLRFTNVRPSQGPQVSEMIVEIKTNIGKQYQVSQKMLSPLMDKSGRTITSKFFTLRQESLDSKGSLRYPSPVPVSVGEMVLFISDRYGAPDRFKVIYELNPATEIAAGDYSAQIVYSITEL